MAKVKRENVRPEWAGGGAGKAKKGKGKKARGGGN